MASFSFPPLLLPTPATSVLPPGAVEAVAPAALLQAELESLPLPQPAAADAPAPAAAQNALDAAAMRPDQLMMSRQLSWPMRDGASLAGSWRGMVRSYGTQLLGRQQQAEANQLPMALLQTGQDPRVLRQPDVAGTPLDAWRFTIHANGQQQLLRVVQGEAEPTLGRRRRGRAALRLELELDDGTVVVVQVEPVADGVRIELCAPGKRHVERLKELQPQLEAAVERAGLRVLGWRYRDTVPEGRPHARLPSVEAAAALNLPVFRAMAELALVLPMQADALPG
jgi:hypothetical protein